MNTTEKIFLVVAAIIIIGLAIGEIKFLSIMVKRKKNWKGLKRPGQAEIVQWVESKNMDDAREVAMAVVLGIENQQPWPIRGLEGLVTKYPAGSVVDVEYAEYPYLGAKDHIDIRVKKEEKNI
jgi:hypothetical protein